MNILSLQFFIDDNSSYMHRQINVEDDGNITPERLRSFLIEENSSCITPTRRKFSNSMILNFLEGVEEEVLTVESGRRIILSKNCDKIELHISVIVPIKLS